ncbi:Mitochondrial import inner membrane translocase subunit TIM50 [Tolypocladium ophioglossoides CBS 100239]|uniref:Mitochondrial import inner membrane translocase subunit TIM50 n=1 Tax=Tolypocladium ophioglossoides (strain CBS 100239) TaxID=1163406 RepID=A0A0L0NAL9_TOLOC|nr:Mitochondrial import inner membrane translocase subunit TIM50 [Tolypocladium ophioglossoides CBS 100239]
MLSRVAQAPRLATAAARLSRPALSPVLRARPAAATISPWIRTYANGQGKPGQKQPPSTSSRSGAASAQSQSSSPQDAKPSNQPRDDGVGAAEEQTCPDASKDTEQIPFHKLPDLTQGIPSTLEQEIREQTGRSQSELEAVDQEDAEGRERRDRRDSYVSTSERNRRWWTRFMLLATAVGSSFGILYMGRDWEDVIEAERHPDVPNGWSPWLWWQRVKARMGESVSYYQDPAFDKLLPDPDPSFERPYTLCLSLDDLLVHSEWSREHGWRVAKRPGMDYFIRYLSQYYELLDPFRFIMWPLYREATKYEDGEIVKDLAYLNRDLSKVIIIDTKASNVRKQPENAIILDPWKGNAKDNDLVGLIPFLEYIHTMQYSDVRKVIKSFDGKHIPTEFARREAIARKEFNKQLEAQKSKHSKPSGMGALGSLLGLKPSNMSMTVAPEGEQNPSEAFAQGKMLQDIARERGQRNYELLEKEIRENGEKWLKEEQVAMEKAQQEAMSTMMGSFSGWFGPKPGEAAGAEKKA